jgi:Tfp pilus assembly protein PilF
MGMAMKLLCAVQEIKHAHSYVESVCRIFGGETDPNLYSAWMFVAEVHERSGDKEGGQAAQTKALKCKSAAVRIRDTSHRSKQRGRKGRK